MKHQGISEFFDKYAPPATEKVVLGEKPKPCKYILYLFILNL